MQETTIDAVRGNTKYVEVTVTNDGVAEDLSTWVVNHTITSTSGVVLSSGVVPDVDPSRRDEGIVDWVISAALTATLPDVSSYHLWISKSGIVRTIALGPLVIDVP